jgi:hypothetical protein
MHSACKIPFFNVTELPTLGYEILCDCVAGGSIAETCTLLSQTHLASLPATNSNNNEQLKGVEEGAKLVAALKIMKRRVPSELNTADEKDGVGGLVRIFRTVTDIFAGL